jgi:glycosyltransferase involved in cell wall biosynthesis
MEDHLKTLLLLYMGKCSITVGAGTERVLVNMANEFVNRGYHVIIATNDDAGSVPFFPLDDRVTLITLGLRLVKMPFYIKTKREINRIFHFMSNPFELWRAGLSARKLNTYIRDIKIDCIVGYTQESVQTANLLGMTGIPVIAMMHNAIRNLLGHADAAMLREREKCDVMQVLMPGFVDQAGQYLPHTHIICIPNAVDYVEPSNRADLQSPKDAYTIITVGRLDPIQKRTHILIEAFALLAKQYPHWHVEIYGDTDGDFAYEKRLRKQITDSHLQERVFLEGRTTKVQEKIRKSAIFAFPSAYEGFPLALTEAMASGIPAVGFRSADAVNELIIDGENGVLCDDGAEAFAAGLKKIMDNQSLRAAMGQKAAISMEPYQSSHIWDMWDYLFQKLIHS